MLVACDVQVRLDDQVLPSGLKFYNIHSTLFVIMAPAESLWGLNLVLLDLEYEGLLPEIKDQVYLLRGRSLCMSSY